ncbi:MAG: universal stress protein [Aeromicrobium sp.]
MTITREVAVGGGILVAHDGSRSADLALRTAVRLAGSFDGRISVVRAWTVASAPRPPQQTIGYIPPLEDFERATMTDLLSDTADVRRDHPDVAISCAVVCGNPAEKLIEASADADLLVIGSRGQGGFLGLLLGSVTDQVVHHARCRVLVDRGPALHEHDPGDAKREQMERALVSELGLDDE